MDGVKLPAPPATSDPLTWIAMTLVLVIVGVVLWQLRASREEREAATKAQAEERAAAAKRGDDALECFREEMAAQRAHDDAQVARTHERIDGLATEVRRIADGRAA